MTAADTNTAAPMASGHAARQHQNWFAQAEGWLDARGKPAWIGATVLGFIFFWPIGLALLFYMLFFRSGGTACANRRSRRMKRGVAMMKGSSGNAAFDAYKAETLRRLEEEQDNFEAFLERLREAKDKAEFDQFMDERARKAGNDDHDPEGPDSRDAA